MISKNATSLSHAIHYCGELLKDYSFPVHTEKWQGMNIQKSPEMMTYEVLNCSFGSSMPNSIDQLTLETSPNIPWAEDHFQERVAGQPLNPGVQWANWPYAKSADRFRTEGDQQFSHTYMERMWPRFAGLTTAGFIDSSEPPDPGSSNFGIRYPYGDLNDLVNQLAHEPDTRQAYLPLWFPEDTGVKHGGRVPCTLGYHFIRRGNFLHMTYYLRSCDFSRHFRDDIYLAVRLCQWILERCKEINPQAWKSCEMGQYTMHMVSLHIFKNDYRMLFGRNHPRD